MKVKNIYIFDEHTSSQKNGIGTYLRELLYCLRSPAYKICLVCFNSETEEFTIMEEKGCKKLLLPMLKGHFLHYVQVIDKLLRLYIKDDPGNIFFVNHSPCSNLLQSLKENFPLSKVFFTIHDFGWTAPFMGSLEKYNRIIKKEKSGQEQKEANNILDIYTEEKRMYESVDGVVCLSTDTFNILHDIYKINKEKLFHIPNGIRYDKESGMDKDKTKRMLHLHSEDKVLLFVGRPTRQKGVSNLIAAMNKVLKSCPSTKLVIIGDGNEVSMKEIINSTSGNAAAIIFTGQLDKKEVRKWISIADIGIISSYYEQCSYAAIEMMIHGLPIVASNGLGIRNMFQDGENARIAKIGNRKHPKEYQNNLTNAIVELLNSPDTCKELGSTAKKTYEEKYHIRCMKQRYNEMIQSL